MRNYRYPNLGDNPRNLCEVCGSVRLNGNCMRSCDGNGPTISLDGRRMNPMLVAMSNQLGSPHWFTNEADVLQSLRWSYARSSGPARESLQAAMDKWGIKLDA